MADSIEKIKKNKKLLVRVIAIILMLAIMVGVTVIFFPWFSQLKTEEGRLALSQYIQSKQTAGIFIFTAIQALQVIFPVIPPVQIVGGALFGPILGSILSCFGLVIGIAVVFVLVKWLGYPLVDAFVDDREFKRFKFLNDEKKVALLAFILYLVPVISPKDTLAFIFPLTKITAKDYFLKAVPARFPVVILSAVVGHNAIKGNVAAVIVLSVIMAAICVVLFVFKNKISAKFHNIREKHKHNKDSGSHLKK